MYVLPRKILVALVGQGSHDMKPVMERKGEGQRQAKANGEPGRSTSWRKGGPLIRSLSVQCKQIKKKRKKRRQQWCLFKIEKKRCYEEEDVF